MKKILLLSFIFLASCSLNKVILHHGVHNLKEKQSKLRINYTNKNDIIKLIGPPSTKSTFDNDVYIYIEKKNSSSKLTKFGKKQLIKNDILVLDINKKGILIAKKFYNKEDMNSIKFDVSSTKTNHSRNSFVYNFLYSLRQKIDDPRGVKRSKK